ncbi:MAG: hypothetical protein LZF62_480230 [Nitrospira sp.]|nr:MAG: hypothetical protein LZF62_480230 [Nitrospira sp.]
MRLVLRVLGLIACLASPLLEEGCAKLTIQQSTFQGDPARSDSAKLSMARGIARSLQTRTHLWGADNAKFGLEIESQTNENDLRLKLYQFAAEAEMTRPSGARTQESTDEDHADAQQIKELIRFLSFDQIGLDEKQWQTINPVQVFGGLGKSEFVLVRDDGGNYNLKSVAFDPSEVVAAGVNSAMGVMRIVATAYGVPSVPMTAAPYAQGTPYPFSGLNSPSLSSYVRMSQKTTRNLDSNAQRFRDDLSGIQDRMKAQPDNAPLPAGVAEAAKGAATRYVRVAAASSRGIGSLQNLARLAPDNDPRERLAAQFNVGALSPRQVLALFWVYRVGLSTDREKQLVTGPLTGLVTFANLNPARKAGQNVSIINDALIELDQSRALTTAVKETREDFAELDAAWTGLASGQTDYAALYAKAKEVVDMFAGVQPANPGDVSTAWTKAQAFSKQFPAESIQRIALNLSSHMEIITALGDRVAVNTASPLVQQIQPHIEKIIALGQVIAGNLSKSSLTQTEAEQIQSQIGKIGFPGAQTTAVDLSVLPNLKQVRDANG